MTNQTSTNKRPPKKMTNQTSTKKRPPKKKSKRTRGRRKSVHQIVNYLSVPYFFSISMEIVAVGFLERNPFRNQKKPATRFTPYSWWCSCFSLVPEVTDYQRHWRRVKKRHTDFFYRKGQILGRHLKREQMSPLRSFKLTLKANHYFFTK